MRPPKCREYFFAVGTFLILISSSLLVDGCSIDFKDVCKNVTCPNGVPCKMDTSYYCEGRFGGVCSPVATCSYDVDPCKNHTCENGSTCVSVTDHCEGEDNTFCTMKAQCNVRSRPGTCPDPKSFPVHSCQNTCVDSDHFCPKDMKCCYSAFALGHFCGATWNITSTATAGTTSVEEDINDPRTQAVRVLHPWNKAPKKAVVNPLTVPLVSPL
ncbi:hypothetical protein BV898_02005 [Hypsibius exemplaris]|uniref:WAP domain-containing protein n=1 Tax=Hypsibius exemplaris TaxID=2072580 RepID=A0A1W0X9H0_HYPEX|nr:hypothetical protein BV898_02005 [Hypsibius exemplaris]